MEKRILHVFIASPGDVAVERQAFKDVLDELNHGFGEGCDTELRPLMWEDKPSSMGRPQALINDDIDQCDCFVLVMHELWGSPNPDSDCSSYTEEEFHRAKDLYDVNGKPKIMLFFKQVDVAKQVNLDKDLERVLRFRKVVQGVGIYKSFGDVSEFKSLLDRHLRLFVKGKLPSPAEERRPVQLIDAIEKIEKAQEEISRLKREAEEQSKALEAKDFEQQLKELDLAKVFARASEQGDIETARQGFDVLAATTRNLTVLHIAALFYLLVGELDKSEKAAQTISKSPDKSFQDIGLHFLGMIYHGRGDLDAAEDYCRKSLELSREASQWGAIVDDLGNLADIYEERGDIDQAEQYANEAIDIHRKYGSVQSEGKLQAMTGSIELKRGNTGNAIEILQGALEKHSGPGKQRDVASNLLSLAQAQHKNGEPEKAIVNYKETLKVAEERSFLDVICAAMNDMGTIAKDNGDNDSAEIDYGVALDIATRLNNRHYKCAVRNNLAVLRGEQGDNRSAAQLLRAALNDMHPYINKADHARMLQNLGNALRKLREFDEAIEVYECAGEFFASIDNKMDQAITFALIAETQRSKGILFAARDNFKKALALFESINDTGNIVKAKASLAELKPQRKHKA